MKNIRKIKSTLLGFNATISRFHISVLFFLLSAIITAFYIGNGNIKNYSELLLAFIMGAGVFMVLQISYEHFFQNKSISLVFSLLAVLAALIYYLFVRFVVEDFSEEHLVRTLILLFVLLMAFMWIPTIKSKVGFSESFMVIFKAFFIVAFYSLVLFLGISLIIAAINMLIINIDYRAYSHVANLIGFLYAPIHFFSLIPVYPPSLSSAKSENNINEEDKSLLTGMLNKAIEPSKFLDGLISYIAIPITAIYTIILLLYILLNITGDFWRDNLMESLLVSYSVIVIVVYLLASVLKSKPAIYFRKIFPKVLIPVVLFQTISSIIKIGEMGITSGRYYVILFGVFATISAILYSIRPNHNNNVIAPILIVLSLISIFPPIDAFKVSKESQVNRLTNVLEENNMLKDDKIIPKDNLTEKDKQIIINSVRYLSRMNYLSDISWLKSYSMNYDFDRTFGFSQYGNKINTEASEIGRYSLYDMTPIDISGYDLFVETDLYGDDSSDRLTIYFEKDKIYTLVQEMDNGMGYLILKDEDENELIRYPLSDIFDSFNDKEEQFGDIPLEEAEFVAENDKVTIYIVTKTINYEKWENESVYQHINAYIMVKIK